MSSQMELLNIKFNGLLTQYRETYQEFINVINSNSDDKNLYKSVLNSSYIGDNNLNVVQNSSIENCSLLCKSNNSCSGATFDNTNNSCTLTSGTGNIINSVNKTAIVKQSLYYSYKLKKLNEELTSINNLLMELTNSKINDYSSIKQNTKEKNVMLNNNYEILESERYEIEDIIRKYETLNSAYQDGSIFVTSNYYNYLIYLLIVIFLIILLFKYNFIGEQIGGGNINFSISSIILIIVSCFVIILNAIIKN
jgi:hypothetical protein